MLSLSPRFDLFRFELPKDFLPKEVEEKYAKILAQNKSVIVEPIDYLNESIQGVTFPGISDLIGTQEQHSHNNNGGRGKINVEPGRSNAYYTPANLLSQVSNELTVTFRRNQGLYNYFMLYETVFHKVIKKEMRANFDDVFHIYILDENGVAVSVLRIMQPMMDGIDGLDFSFNKVERQSETFDVKFRYNNIDFNILEDNKIK